MVGLVKGPTGSVRFCRRSRWNGELTQGEGSLMKTLGINSKTIFYIVKKVFGPMKVLDKQVPLPQPVLFFWFPCYWVSPASCHFQSVYLKSPKGSNIHCKLIHLKRFMVNFLPLIARHMKCVSSESCLGSFIASKSKLHSFLFACRVPERQTGSKGGPPGVEGYSQHQREEHEDIAVQVSQVHPDSEDSGCARSQCPNVSLTPLLQTMLPNYICPCHCAMTLTCLPY